MPRFNTTRLWRWMQIDQRLFCGISSSDIMELSETWMISEKTIHRDLETFHNLPDRQIQCEFFWRGNKLWYYDDDVVPLFSCNRPNKQQRVKYWERVTEKIAKNRLLAERRKKRRKTAI